MKGFLSQTAVNRLKTPRQKTTKEAVAEPEKFQSRIQRKIFKEYKNLLHKVTAGSTWLSQKADCGLSHFVHSIRSIRNDTVFCVKGILPKRSLRASEHIAHLIDRTDCPILSFIPSWTTLMCATGTPWTELTLN